MLVRVTAKVKDACSPGSKFSFILTHISTLHISSPIPTPGHQISCPSAVVNLSLGSLAGSPNNGIAYDISLTTSAIEFIF